MQSHLLSGSLHSLNPQSLGGNIAGVNEKVIFIFIKNMHGSMREAEKSPLRSAPFKIIKVMHCQGERRTCAGRLWFIGGLSADHAHVEIKTFRAQSSSSSAEQKRSSEEKKHKIKQIMKHRMAQQHPYLVWQAEDRALIEEHSLLQMHSLKLKSGLLNLMDLLTQVKATG